MEGCENRPGGSGVEELRGRLYGWVQGTDLPLAGVYLVGGSVRDAVLKRPCADLDICLRGAEAFAKKLARGRDAAFVPMEKDPSAPCYRLVSRKDPEDYVDVAEMRGEDIFADLARRDFAINAMAVSALAPETSPGAEIVDPYNGRADLAAGVIRHVSEQNLFDDPLRVLRGFRLAAILEFRISPDTLEAFSRAVSGLDRTSGERIGREFLLLLAARRAHAVLGQMDACGAMSVLLPELDPLRGLTQNLYHHLDAFAHTLESVQHAEEIVNEPGEFFPECAEEVRSYLEGTNRPALIKLALLLHDVGKARTRGTNPRTGLPTFHGHEAVSAQMTRYAAARLRLSNRDRDYISKIVDQHLRPLFLTADQTGEKRRIAWMRKMEDDCAGVIIASMADNLSKAPSVEECRPAALSSWLCEYYKVLRPRFREIPLLTGRDLLDLGASPGPDLGRILSEVKRAQDAGELSSREAAKALARKLLHECKLD
ncbi:MAG: HD domain-containing protein [Thermodesulfobacteriota bacterium]